MSRRQGWADSWPGHLLLALVTPTGLCATGLSGQEGTSPLAAIMVLLCLLPLLVGNFNIFEYIMIILSQVDVSIFEGLHFLELYKDR